MFDCLFSSRISDRCRKLTGLIFVRAWCEIGSCPNEAPVSRLYHKRLLNDWPLHIGVKSVNDESRPSDSIDRSLMIVRTLRLMGGRHPRRVYFSIRVSLALPPEFLYAPRGPCIIGSVLFWKASDLAGEMYGLIANLTMRAVNSHCGLAGHNRSVNVRGRLAK